MEMRIQRQEALIENLRCYACSTVSNDAPRRVPPENTCRRRFHSEWTSTTGSLIGIIPEVHRRVFRTMFEPSHREFVRGNVARLFVCLGRAPSECKKNSCSSSHGTRYVTSAHGSFAHFNPAVATLSAIYPFVLKLACSRLWE